MEATGELYKPVAISPVTECHVPIEQNPLPGRFGEQKNILSLLGIEPRIVA
jgi:hypothetical protein